MSAEGASAAFNQLVSLAELSKVHAKGLPAQIDAKPYWSGIGFSLFGINYVAPMGEVSEMLEMPGFTRLPGVNAWVKGVANVRGRLLPLTDLAMFLGGKLASSWRQQRVLVVETGEIYSGLVVDGVFGMQHFLVESYSQTLSEGAANSETEPFLQGSFRSDDGKEWIVFSPWALVRSDKFFQAALGA